MIFDTLENIKNYEGLGRVYTALKFLSETDFTNMPLGKYELCGDDIFYMVQEYETDPEKTLCEAHKKYIDIQLIVTGVEAIGVVPDNDGKTLVSAKPENDVWFYECETQKMILTDGCFMVLYPSDLHSPGVGVNGKKHFCRKVVVKVKV